MYLVLLRGAVGELSRAGALAGAAAVACVREFADDPTMAEWLPRPGKVCLRARTESQWRQVLELPHTLAEDAAAALPPRRRSERGPLLERIDGEQTAEGMAEESPVGSVGAVGVVDERDQFLFEEVEKSRRSAGICCFSCPGGCKVAGAKRHGVRFAVAYVHDDNRGHAFRIDVVFLKEHHQREMPTIENVEYGI